MPTFFKIFSAFMKTFSLKAQYPQVKKGINQNHDLFRYNGPGSFHLTP